MGKVDWQGRKGHRENFGIMEVFYVFIVMVIRWVYTFVKTHKIAHLKCVHFICKLYLSKVDFFKCLSSCQQHFQLFSHTYLSSYHDTLFPTFSFLLDFITFEIWFFTFILSLHGKFEIIFFCLKKMLWKDNGIKKRVLWVQIPTLPIPKNII